VRFLLVSLGVCRPCFCERMHACMYTWFTTGRAAQHSETTTACSHSGAAECGDPAKVASSLLIVAGAVRAQTIARSQNNSHASPALINSQNNSCTSAPGKTSTNLSQTYSPRVQSDRWILPRMLSLHTREPESDYSSVCMVLDMPPLTNKRGFSLLKLVWNSSESIVVEQWAMLGLNYYCRSN
jgi:hypothetical protein